MNEHLNQPIHCGGCGNRIDEGDHRECAAKAWPVTWREYIIRLPKSLADTVDKALGMQKQMEDREIENSEYWAWLLMLGLMEVQRQNAAAQEADKRIATPADLAFKDLRRGRGQTDVIL